jgi:glycosyltransferase involved in cell wall biosynthesis
VGGVEWSTRDLCEALVAEHGFAVTVATTDAFTIARFHDASQPTIPIVPGETQNGVEILRFPVDTSWSRTLRQLQRLFWRLRLPGNDVLRTLFNGPRSHGLRAAARSLDADVICAASFPLNHMRFAFERTRPRPPVVLVPAVHTKDAWGFDRPNLLRLTKAAYATVAHTDHERQWLISRGAPPDRTVVIGHGIDPACLVPRPGVFREAEGIDPEGFLVAFVGQHGRHKGIDTLVGAFARLADRRRNVWLAITGAPTPYTDHLQRLVAALPDRVRERVRVIAHLTEQEKADVLGDCDVFASPSTAESFGITTLEAWALRKAVVVGDLPSQRCVVEDGTSGLLVRPGDVAALVTVLERLADDYEFREALGEAGHGRLLSRYRRKDVERAYAELFRAAAAGEPVRQIGIGDG